MSGPAVLLIRPSFASGPQGRYSKGALLEPLALGILAALTPDPWQVEVVDERLDEVPSTKVDLVAISTCTFSARRAYEISADFRRRGVLVVLGGIHPTLVPEEAAEHADAVALGDAEAVWPEILDDALGGRLRPRYGHQAHNPSPAATPDRTAYDPSRYLPLSLIQFGRGCRHSCEFCSVQTMYGRSTSSRPVAEVVAEIEGCSNRRLFFVDDNLLNDRRALRELLEALVPLKVRWSSQMDLTIADDIDLLALAKRSGCQSLTIGFESLSQSCLRQMGKAWNQAESYSERLRLLRSAGIMVYGTFVLGYDGDTPATIHDTRRFAERERLFMANFNPLQPLPGTPLFARLEKQGRLRYQRWWLDPDYRWQEALFEPTTMSADELSQGCRRAREAFHGGLSLLRRLMSPAHVASIDNLLVYLGANWVSRSDIRAKSGLSLGSWDRVS